MLFDILRNLAVRVLDSGVDFAALPRAHTGLAELRPPRFTNIRAKLSLAASDRGVKPRRGHDAPWR